MLPALACLSDELAPELLRIVVDLTSVPLATPPPPLKEYDQPIGPSIILVASCIVWGLLFIEKL